MAKKNILDSFKTVRLPKKITIKDNPVTIVSRSKSWAKRHKVFGQFTLSSDNQHLIEWDKTQPEQEVVNTILHEILHAIYQQNDIPRKPSEEEVVTKLTNGLEEALRGNQHLLDWFYKKLKTPTE